MAVLYWQSDDEFPAESKLLYDKTISKHLENDIIYALAVGVCKVLSSLCRTPPAACLHGDMKRRGLR